MTQRRALTFVPVIGLIALLPACATEKTNAVARATASDAVGSALPHELIGGWSGRFGPALGEDSGGGNGMAGDLTLEIKDDGTYRLLWARRGRGDAAGTSTTESGVVIPNGRGVTLKSTSGQSTTLMRSGDALYAVIYHRSGHAIQMSVEKDSGAFASPRQ